jgi:hypothetical protein
VSVNAIEHVEAAKGMVESAEDRGNATEVELAIAHALIAIADACLSSGAGHSLADAVLVAGGVQP